MKKLLCLGLALVMVLGMFAGCGQSEPAPAEKPEAEEPVTEEPAVEEPEVEEPAAEEEEEASEAVPVTMWYYWEGENQQASMNAQIAKYNDAQDAFELSAKYIPFADFKKQLSIGATAGQLPDLVVLDSPDHASYAAMGVFADLTDRFDTEKYFEGPIASCTLDGKLYGVPMGVNCLSLYYNEDMLAEAGVEVPTTWDELKEAAAKLTTDTVTGLAFCSRPNEEGTFNFMPWVWSTGASSFEIGTENGVKALTFVKELVDAGSMSKEVINWTQGDVMNQFISGNVAMMINGPWQIPVMRSEAPDLKWNVTLIPKDAAFASDLGGENYAVIAGGNEEAALDFLDFVSMAENNVELMNGFGYISADKAVAENQFADDEIMLSFVDQLQYAQPRGPHAEWPSISDAISLAFNQVITGEAEPADAAAAAQATIDGILG